MSEKYIVKMLFGQRTCSYDGEYAPEVLDAIDEYTHDEANTMYLEEKLLVLEKTKEFASLKIIDIQLDRKEIDDILSPKIQTLKGEINIRNQS